MAIAIFGSPSARPFPRPRRRTHPCRSHVSGRGCAVGQGRIACRTPAPSRVQASRSRSVTAAARGAARAILPVLLTLLAFAPGEARAQASWTISIANAGASEGDSLTFTISLDNTHSSDLSVLWRTYDKTALAPGDYTAQAQATTTIPAGSTSTTVTVPTAENTVADGNRVFLVLITLPSERPDNVFLSPLASAAEGTIRDDDSRPGAPTGLSATFDGDTGNVELSWNAPTDTGLLNSAAAAITGYQVRTARTSAALSSATWTSTGATSTAYTFGNLGSGKHFFEVRALTGVTDANGRPAASSASNQAMTTVVLPTWTVSIANAGAPEGDAVTFTISVDNAHSSDLSVLWRTYDNTAFAPGDYTAQAQTTTTIPAGSTSTTVTVPTVENTLADGNRVFLALITLPSERPGNVFLSPFASAAEGTIRDDDSRSDAPTGLSANFDEATGNVDLSWNAPTDPGVLNGAAATVVGYQIRTATTREGLDAARWFDTGDTRVAATLSGRAIGDHYFQVRAITGVTDANGAPAGAVSGIASVTGRLPVPTVPGALRATQRTESAIQIAWSASTYSGSEGVVYTSERRTSGSGNPWVETGSGADTHRRFAGLVVGTDYDFRVRACAAGTDECSGYAQGTFATLAAPAAAVATLVLAPLTIDESGPNNAATLRATLDTALGTTTTLNVSAVPPGAVTLSGTTLTIPAGETESTGSGIRITAVDDEVASGADARVTLSATAPAGVGAPALVTLTVAEDDTAPATMALSVHPTSVSEDGSATPITVTAAFPPGSATLPTATAVKVQVGTSVKKSDHSATPGTDYESVGDITVTIPARKTRGTRTFTFTPLRDADDSEGLETVSVTGSAAGVAVEPAALTVADRGTRILSVADASAPEGTPVAFTVRLSGRTLERNLELVARPSSESGDTATAGADYATAVRNVTLPARRSSATFSVATTRDGNVEPDETFTVTLSARPGTSLPAGVTIADARATGTIMDDDLAAHRLPLVISGSHPLGLRSIVRLVNHSGEAGAVRIEAFDDEGVPYGPVTLTLSANQSTQFSSADLEGGNADKGLARGVGDGEGDWRLELTSTLDLQVLGYVLTTDGFLATMHDVVPGSEAGHRVPFFNPGRNRGLASQLRLVNPGAEATVVTIEGIDARGRPGESALVLSVPAGAARTFSASELESGEAEDLSGALGTGAGKWQLVVTADRPVVVMSLLASATGYLSNLSTAPPPWRAAPSPAP